MKKETTSNTIFDDVFRTMVQKMPQLLIPVINEVFQTNYAEDDYISQLRNEHEEQYGKGITDSIIQIGKKLYHIECQSTEDSTMVIRMIEYEDIRSRLEAELYDEGKSVLYEDLIKLNWNQRDCFGLVVKKVVKREQ